MNVTALIAALLALLVIGSATGLVVYGLLVGVGVVYDFIINSPLDPAQKFYLIIAITVGNGVGWISTGYAYTWVVDHLPKKNSK